MKTVLLLILGLAFAAPCFAQVETAQRNEAACKITNENWCGSGSICGYWTDEMGVKGALALTNAHVATTRIGDRMQATFVMPGGQARTFTAVNLIAAYSNTAAVDWAIIFIPGLTEDFGIEPLKLSKEAPVGNVFQFTGSPRCVWPLTNIDIRLVNSTARGVVMWQPVTIGGQSGSSVRRMLPGGKSVAEILLTWSWNRNGAGQPTSLIYNNVQNKNNIGPVRPEGLIEVSQGDNTCESGYFEAKEISEMTSVSELPIWADDDDVDPPDPPSTSELTASEIASAVKLKTAGYSIEAIADYHMSLLKKKSVEPSGSVINPAPTPATRETDDSIPDASMLQDDTFVNPELTLELLEDWTPPVPPYHVGQIHSGRILEKQCVGDECKYYWVVIK